MNYYFKYFVWYVKSWINVLESPVYDENARQDWKNKNYLNSIKLPQSPEKSRK